MKTAKEGELLVFPPGCLGTGGKTDNQCRFKLSPGTPDAEDNSRINFNIIPLTEGHYWVHFLIGNVELESSPLPVQVVKSDEHRRLDDLAKSERDRLERERELRRLEKLRLKQLRDEEQQRLQREKEEALRRKQEETKKRADEIMKRAKEARDEELRLKDEERKYQKEMRTGGGFNLKKHQEMMALKKAQ